MTDHGTITLVLSVADMPIGYTPWWSKPKPENPRFVKEKSLVPNFNVQEPVSAFTLPGTVTLDGAPVERIVRAYNRETGELVGSTVSAADGTFSIEIYDNDTSREYYVTVLDDDADAHILDPITHDRLTANPV